MTSKRRVGLGVTVALAAAAALVHSIHLVGDVRSSAAMQDALAWLGLLLLLASAVVGVLSGQGGNDSESSSPHLAPDPGADGSNP